MEIGVLVCKMPKFSACGGLTYRKTSQFWRKPAAGGKILGCIIIRIPVFIRIPPLIKQIFSKGGILNINTPDVKISRDKILNSKPSNFRNRKTNVSRLSKPNAFSSRQPKLEFHFSRWLVLGKTQKWFLSSNVPIEEWARIWDFDSEVWETSSGVRSPTSHGKANSRRRRRIQRARSYLYMYKIVVVFFFSKTVLERLKTKKHQNWSERLCKPYFKPSNAQKTEGIHFLEQKCVKIGLNISNL